MRAGFGIHDRDASSSDHRVQQDYALSDKSGDKIKSDLAPQDAAADTAHVDAVVANPCAPPTMVVPWQSNMAICKLSENLVTQCAAGSYCTSGWHLCTATEYLTNGGKTSGPPDGGDYWLAACIREGNTMTAPDTGSVCSGDCNSTQEIMFTVEWHCNASVHKDSPWTPTGVIAANSCNRVGVDAAKWEGYWRSAIPEHLGAGVLCCK